MKGYHSIAAVLFPRNLALLGIWNSCEGPGFQRDRGSMHYEFLWISCRIAKACDRSMIKIIQVKNLFTSPKLLWLVFINSSRSTWHDSHDHHIFTSPKYNFLSISISLILQCCLLNHQQIDHSRAPPSTPFETGQGRYMTIVKVDFGKGIPIGSLDPWQVHCICWTF